MIPGLASYSLGNLCQALEITNERPHRAWADAEATTKLLGLLLDRDEQTSIEQVVAHEISAVKLPPNLDKQIVDDLPEETGVYYFLDKEGHPLYVGKSTNVRKRILSHFQGAHKAGRTMELLRRIHHVDYTLTGSELIALLLENEEIKRIQPPYNRAQRRRKYKYGIYTHETEAGYLALFVDTYDEARLPVAGYSGKTHAESALKARGRKYELCPKLYGAEQGPGRCFHYQLHICKGACIQEESPESYNERVEQAIYSLSYGKDNMATFFVVGEGRNYQERSVVYVERGFFRGYTYLDVEALAHDPASVIDSIPLTKEAPDVQRIIQGYIKKHPKEIVMLPKA